MPKRPDHLRLVDLAEAAEGIVSRLADTTFEQFVADQDLQEIVLWRLVKLGEAAAHVSRNCAPATRPSKGQSGDNDAATTRLISHIATG
jgi:uncharacterized protein with HEPN domain